MVKVVVATTLFSWKRKKKTKINIKNIVRNIAMMQRKKVTLKYIEATKNRQTKNRDPIRFVVSIKKIASKLALVEFFERLMYFIF